MNTSQVIISPYNPQWKSLFNLEKKRLQTTLSDVTIEHIGSTSITGLDAKPTIDILVGSLSIATLIHNLKTLINSGYIAEGSRTGHYWLCKPSPDKRDYIVHLVVTSEDEWKRRIAFRDYLITHPKKVKEYETLKHHLALQYPNNLDAYTTGKARFVSKIVRLALHTL